MAEEQSATFPTMFALRTPTVNSAELVITVGGKSITYPLSFTQTRLLAAQATQAVTHWPVKEVPAI